MSVLNLFTGCSWTLPNFGPEISGSDWVSSLSCMDESRLVGLLLDVQMCVSVRLINPPPSKEVCWSGLLHHQVLDSSVSHMWTYEPKVFLFGLTFDPDSIVVFVGVWNSRTRRFSG